MTGEAHFVATNGFFEHVAMIAGFILAAIIAEQEQRSARQSVWRKVTPTTLRISCGAA